VEDFLQEQVSGAVENPDRPVEGLVKQVQRAGQQQRGGDGNAGDATAAAATDAAVQISSATTSTDALQHHALHQSAGA
jgi:hypothetical protein